MPEYIKREDIFQNGYVCFNLNNAEKSIRDFVNHIMNIPAANVAEVKYGEWVKAGSGITERIVCSCCKSSKGSYLRPPFCNQCGANMKEIKR